MGLDILELNQPCKDRVELMSWQVCLEVYGTSSNTMCKTQLTYMKAFDLRYCAL